MAYLVGPDVHAIACTSPSMLLKAQDPQRFHGLELRCDEWRVDPLDVSLVKSSYFDDATVFPRGSLELDCAVLMRGIRHEWHNRADRCSC